MQVTEGVYGHKAIKKLWLLVVSMRFNTLNSDKFVMTCLTPLSCLIVHKM